MVDFLDDVHAVAIYYSFKKKKRFAKPHRLLKVTFLCVVAQVDGYQGYLTWLSGALPLICQVQLDKSILFNTE